MSDLISREEAIDDLRGRDPSQIWDTADIEVWVNALPSAQPERIRGRWIDKSGGIATCSKCGDRWGVWSVMKYCPNCGAEMEASE